MRWGFARAGGVGLRSPTVRRALVGWLLLWLGAAACEPSPSGSRAEVAHSVGRIDEVPCPLPGVATWPKDVADRIAERTSGGRDAHHSAHMGDDGQPKYVNRLALQSSPYLQQHAHNPVNWYPWGDEAFEAARRLGRPVLLSVGYSTCHWCHVMARESFEDLEIAQYLNEHYVAVKVDREERPDVDAIYMQAVRMLSGQGGWPMTVWLTPDRQPFFGGTYFPARSGDRGPGTGFLELLRQNFESYSKDPVAVQQRGAELAERVKGELERDRRRELADARRPLEAAYMAFERSFDTRAAGWGHQKFPMPSRLRFLLRYWRRTGDERALVLVHETLDAMRRGGLYDHVGGGFHRYTVDPRWRVPHFEKMLYDNAQLALLYTEAWQATKRPEYAQVVRATLEYLQREMRSAAGGFYAATDADSEGEEGKFFVWTLAEVRAVLGDEADLVIDRFGIMEPGSFEGANVLSVAKTVDQLAQARDVRPADVRTALDRSLAELRRARERRVRPHRDEKVIAAWNGLAIEAFARAGFAFGVQGWIDQAAQTADFVMKELRGGDGVLSRSWTEDGVSAQAFADDYAFVVAGMFALFESTSDPRWLRAAEGFQERLDRDHWTPGGYVYARVNAGEAMMANPRPFEDGALPSANGVALHNLLRLGLTSGAGHRERARELIGAFGAELHRNAAAMPTFLGGLDWVTDTPHEVVVVGADGEELVRVLRERYGPNQVMVVRQETPVAGPPPWVEGKVAREGRATAYVCHDSVCKLPTSSPSQFTEQLEAFPSLRE